MGGRVTQLIVDDVKRILNGDFSSTLTIYPDGHECVEISGIVTRHAQSFDTDGLSMVGNNAHVSIVEKDLNDLGIITRYDNGALKIKGWRCKFSDAIEERFYRFAECYADSKIGLIRIDLELLK